MAVVGSLHDPVTPPNITALLPSSGVKLNALQGGGHVPVTVGLVHRPGIGGKALSLHLPLKTEDGDNTFSVCFTT